ncbi:hypothetical protein BGZ83_003152 [Gryganskiella cystojenkinii]|nr:hypothetical protein BGZ83_003152 [Gryganskiella cystojenkinii]
MATWISNYLASLGLGQDFESYFTGVLYDQDLSEEDKSATIYECLETNCDLENVNLQDTVAELFAQYNQNGLFWMEAPLYPYNGGSTLDFQYQPANTPGVSRAIQIVRPLEDQDLSTLDIGDGNWSSEAESSRNLDSYARIDDDDEANDAEGEHGGVPRESFLQAPRDVLDPFDDDEFNPFAPPSASDLEVLNSTRTLPSFGSYHSDQPQQYPPPIFYSSDDAFAQGEGDDGSTLDQDMTPLEMLVLIIRDVSPEKIEMAFEKAGYDFESTLSLLMTEKSKEVDVLAQFVPQQSGRSMQTCRHFLQGNCFRKDCWYSHDLDAMVCKFWLKGQCLKGETCEFNHFLDANKIVVDEPVVIKQQPPAMDDFDFPSLSASSTSNKIKGPSKPANGKKNKKYQKISDLDALDGAPTNGDSGSHHDQDNGSIKSASSPVLDELATQLQEQAKISSPPLARQGISYSATAAAAASKPLTPLKSSSSSSTGDVEKQRKAFTLQTAPSTIPWLETGSTLNSSYLKSRAQAIEYAKARNQCFELATQAYLRNDGAAASQLSNKGREYNELMMATHRDASRQIFNSRHQSMIKSEVKGETWIDLHGLHVDESLAFLDEFMEKLEKELYSGTVYIVTGTGNHSVNKRAKLRPAVIDWLDSWGYVWKEMSLDKVHGGVLAVQVIDGKA